MASCDPQHVPQHRYVTTDNIRAGDVILEEEPWMWNMMCLSGQFQDSASYKMVCHYCLLLPGKLLTCSACKSARYCSIECQRADWTLRHKHGDCHMQKAIAQLRRNKGIGSFGESMHQFEFLSIIRRLLFSAASKRLFSAKQRDENGNPSSPLWNAVLNSPSKTDSWADVDRKLGLKQESAIYRNLVRMVTWDDLPNKLIAKRILSSLVLMCDYGDWKKLIRSMQTPTESTSFPDGLALGACLEISKFPNNCNPNAVVINEGRLVRMVALEDIPNLDAVRLSRTPVWFDTRFSRRTMKLYGIFGFDCNCARCCAGDSGETMLFALRCPKWADLHNASQDTSSGCDGIVTGLRRADIGTYDNSHEFDANIAAFFDEPRRLSAEVTKKPAYVRAECQKCHARYDKVTMDRILNTLAHMARMSVETEHYSNSDSATRGMCMAVAGNAEKYVYPTNYAYIVAEKIWIFQYVGALVSNVRLDVNSLTWLQRSARRMLARIESRGYQQHDLSDLFGTAALYAVVVPLLRRGSGGMQTNDRDSRSAAILYEQTAALLERVTKAALLKIRPSLVHE